jgi:nicotinate phosphoribosyltransferase
VKRLKLFHTASDEEIKEGKTADVYFERTLEVLKAKGFDKTKVTAEMTVSSFPKSWLWGVLAGVEEAARLLEGCPVDVDIMPEGTVFHAKDCNGFRSPVMRLYGSYGSWCKLDTALLGLFCQASGIATTAAKVKKAAGNKIVMDFGARRMHPCLSALIGRAAYIAGIDAVSSIAAAKLIGVEAMGTMPHALIIIFGDQVKAWKAFDEVVAKNVPRIALVDTYCDEKTEAILAAEALKDHLNGIRLDTPGSRRGNFSEIIKEVRWELDSRGYKDVKIYVSGGLDIESVKHLSEAGADGFGVGTYVSNAEVVDFALDIVEMGGRSVAKRGKLGGSKQLWRCQDCFVDVTLPSKDPPPKCPQCGEGMEAMLIPLLRSGKIVAELPQPKEIRKYVIDQLKKIALEQIYPGVGN